MPVLDDLEFAREAGEHFGAQRLVAFARAVETELPQIRKGGFAVRNNTFRENEFAECELQVTAVGDFCCSVQPFRVVGKTLLHFGGGLEPGLDRKSTRLNSSHMSISYAVFCLKKKKKKQKINSSYKIESKL